MSESTYQRLGNISNDRLASTDTYWPIEQARDLLLDDLDLYHGDYLSKGGTIGVTDYSLPAYERKIHFLRSVGVQAVRYTLIGFGYFDSSDKIQALPMYSDHKNRNARDSIGSFHNVIWNDYYKNSGVNEEGDVRFMSAGGLDVIGGETVRLFDQEKAVTHLRIPRDTRLSPSRVEAMAEMSAVFPMAKYVVLTKGLSEYTTFDEGTVETHNFNED